MRTAVGFIGLGVIGTPMALDLARAGTPPVIWNRSHGSDEALRDVARRAIEGPPDRGHDGIGFPPSHASPHIEP